MNMLLVILYFKNVAILNSDIPYLQKSLTLSFSSAFIFLSDHYSGDLLAQENELPKTIHSPSKYGLEITVDLYYTK